ncbi:MAG TPA: ACT domain-containing protein [Candidatus Limnocylindrales bacterium]
MPPTRSSSSAACVARRGGAHGSRPACFRARPFRAGDPGVPRPGPGRPCAATRAARSAPAACRGRRLAANPQRDRGGSRTVANQFVIQLPNRPGALADLSEILGARGVDLRAIGGGGIGDSGHLIFKTSDDAVTRAVLEEGHYEFIEGESLLVEVDDQPGGMARVARRLADAGVNIYGHLFIGRWGDQAQFSFVVDDIDAARAALDGLSSVSAG